MILKYAFKWTSKYKNVLNNINLTGISQQKTTSKQRIVQSRNPLHEIISSKLTSKISGLSGTQLLSLSIYFHIFF